MVHDLIANKNLNDEQKPGSYRDLLKLHLLCERLNLSPVTVSALIKDLRKDLGFLLGQQESEIGFDVQFLGREFDLLFTFKDPTPKFGNSKR